MNGCIRHSKPKIVYVNDELYCIDCYWEHERARAKELKDGMRAVGPSPFLEAIGPLEIVTHARSEAKAVRLAYLDLSESFEL